MEEEGPEFAEKQGKQEESAIWTVSDQEKGVAIVVWGLSGDVVKLEWHMHGLLLSQFQTISVRSKWQLIADENRVHRFGSGAIYGSESPIVSHQANSPIAKEIHSR